MRTKLYGSLSGMLLALAGCSTDNTHTAAPAPAYGPPPVSAPSSQVAGETRPYAYNPPPAQAPQQANEPAPAYREQAPTPDPSAQDAPPTSIQRVEDFQEPLRDYGRWLDTPEYGRVWQPYNQPGDWRPYSSDGQWAYTSWGWTWQSTQPWGWAAYHYGNWVFTPQCGWVWSPGVVWAPAWVVWRECDDYVAWAPAPPAQFHFFYSSSDYCDWGVRYSDYVVVPRNRFCQPIYPGVAVPYAQNVKYVNKTKNVTKTKFVNKGVINYGPSVAGIEAATGQKVQARKVAEVVRQPDRNTKLPRVQTNDREEPKRSSPARADFERPSRKQTDTPASLASIAPPAPQTHRIADSQPAAVSRSNHDESGKSERKAGREIEQRVVRPTPSPARSELQPTEDKRAVNASRVQQERKVRANVEQPKSVPAERPNKAESRDSERKVERRILSQRAMPPEQVADSPRSRGSNRNVETRQMESRRADRMDRREARAEQPRRESTVVTNDDPGKRKREDWDTGQAGRRERGSFTPGSPSYSQPVNNR